MPGPRKRRSRKKHVITLTALAIAIFVLCQMTDVVTTGLELFLGWETPGWVIGITSLAFIAATLLLWLEGRGS